MSMTIDELNARQSEIRGRLQELDSDNAGAELPSEARSEWNKLNEEFEGNVKLISELTARRDRVAKIAGDPEHQEPAGGLQVPRPGVARGEDIWDLSTVRGGIAPGSMARELRDRAQRAIEQTVPAHEKADKEAVQGELARMQDKLDGPEGAFSRHLLFTGSPVYKRAFAKAISGQNRGTEEERALNLTGATGGYLLPYTLDPTIIPTSNLVVNPLRSISRVVQTTTNLWKGVTSGGMTAAYREAEAEETTDDSPEFVQPEITAHAADAFAQWTYEFGEDYGSIAPELAVLVQDAKDELEATKFATGSGTNEPFGVLTGAEEIVETATSKAFAVADVYALEQALGARFRAMGQWVANRAIYNKIRQFDTYGGASLWVRLSEGLANSPQGNVSQRLLDYGTNELSTMDATVEEHKLIALFGDFRYYIIADRIGTIAKPIADIPGEEGRPTGQSGLYFFWRNGAKVMSKKAFRKLKVKE